MATTGKKKPKPTDDISQTAALVAMIENGLSRKDAGRVLGLSKAKVDKALDDTRLELRARASDYADIHFEAAKIAAAKGRAEPAQWALERIGVVEPEAAKPAGAAGPIIKIGIMLPGLPAQAITVESRHEDHSSNVEEVLVVDCEHDRASGS